MKKTHSANIGGTVFAVEDDAYELLQGYLQAIELHFRSYPDVADIIADIEGRIAEQLLQREGTVTVVRTTDVERVIAAMGRVEEFADPEAVPPQPASPVRKLYRDPDHKVIAGVAAGLASYLGVPVLPVRLVLVLLAFFFGAAIVAYLLLWALVPVASSTTEKLQMRGQPVTLASIDQDVRDGIAGFPQSTRNFAARSASAVGSLIHLVVVTIARVVRGIAGVLVVGATALGVLFLTVLLVVALVNANAPPLHPAVAAFFATFGSWQHVFKVVLFLIAAIPLALLLVTGLNLFWGVRRVNARGLAGMLGAWLIALLAAAVIWSSSYPQLRTYWDEYPAMAAARDRLDSFQRFTAATAPLSEAQSQSLLTALLAEQKRRLEEDRAQGYWHWQDGGTYLRLQEQRITDREAGNQRVIESARAYLDATQLSMLQDFLSRHMTLARTELQARIVHEERERERYLEREQQRQERREDELERQRQGAQRRQENLENLELE